VKGLTLPMAEFRSTRHLLLGRSVREVSDVSVARHTRRALVAQDPGPHPPSVAGREAIDVAQIRHCRDLNQRVGLRASTLS
jgi:hypothetical protein